MSDTISVSLTPGYQFPLDGSVELTYALLNLLGRPTVDLTGAIGTLALADGSVTTVKLGANALAASTAGRGKMQDGFFAADAASRAKFVATFFGAGDATSLAFFADGFWTANAAGRAKMADGFITGPKLAATAAPLIASSRNLLITNNSGTPNSQIDITADEVILKNSSGAPYLAGTVSLTANIAASGANGLDTGAEAGSTWYYIWLIYNDTAVASLLSVSSTAPTLPGGYTYKALVGTVRNDGSSNFVRFLQQDREVWINDTNLFTAKTAAVANTYESYQAGGGGADVDLRTLVPPTAKRLRGTLGNNSSGNIGVAVAGDASGLGGVTVVATNASGSALNGFSVGGAFQVPLRTAQTFYWKGDSTTARARVNICGFTL